MSNLIQYIITGKFWASFTHDSIVCEQGSSMIQISVPELRILVKLGENKIKMQSQ